MKQIYLFKRLFASFILLLATSFSWAYDFEVNGICYNKNSDGTSVTVTDKSYKNGYSGSVTIPATVTYNSKNYNVTSIGNYAFQWCEYLTSVFIPYGVTSIGDDAFIGCSKLTTVTIPYSLTTIGMTAFHDCSSLTSIYIPSFVFSIKVAAFSGCTKLTSITVDEGNFKYDSRNNCNAIIERETNKLISGCKNTVIPDGVTSIGEHAYYDCFDLASTTIPNSVTSIEQDAFHGCSSLTSVTCLAEEVPSTGNNVFYNVPQSTATLYVPAGSVDAYKAAAQWKEFGQILPIEDGPTIIDFADANVKQLCVANWDTSGDGELDEDEAAAVTSLGEVFRNKTTITSFDELQYFTGLTEISDNAFRSCSNLTTVTIPNSVTSIGRYAFYNCSGLTSVTIPNSVTSIGESAFFGCSGLTSITIPNNVTSIGDFAFYNCSGLTSVTIPNSVTSIGDFAFQRCYGLTSVTIPNSVTSIGGGAFEGCTSLPMIDNIRYADTYLVGAVDKTQSTYNIKAGTRIIGSSAFSGCSSLTSITIPESVTSIGSSAFSGCSGLTSVTIPNSVTSIGMSVFSGCSGLTSINIPNSVTSIGESAFCFCSGLTSITIPNNVTSIGYLAFYGCTGLTKAEFASIENLCKISFGGNSSNPLSYAKHLYIGGQEMKDVIIPNSVTSINDWAFHGGSSLKSVTIPESVTSIRGGAFYNCSGLKSVIIPNSVTSIGNSAFYNCSNLTSVTIPESVTSIGANAFENCSGLTSVTIPNGVTIIGYEAFRGCSSLTSITIPNSVTSISDRAFYVCSGLTSVTIGNGVTRIGIQVFGGCSGLTSVTCLAETVPSMDDLVFEGVPRSTATLYVPSVSLNAYKAAAQWKEFGNIVGIDPTAVEELKSKKILKANENAPIYDLMGRRLSKKPTSGYYIRNGKKYFVK